MSTPTPDSARDHRFLTDLLGVMAYSELSAFERLSSDARYAPTLRDRAVLGRLAVREFEHYDLVCARLQSLGEDVEAAMVPFQRSVDHFHERTRPADWFESLMKAYVIDTVSADFYRSLIPRLDTTTAALVERVQASEEATEVLRERLKQALADDPRLASRLALWARRLLGEALTQAQRVAADHAFLGVQDAKQRDAGAQGIGAQDTETTATGTQAADPGRALLAGLATAHSRRMALLGLAG